jgi:PAS domain S-box-containing protein
MDVTQEKEISRELHQAREQAEIFFEASHDLLAILTPEGRFVRCSRSWERLLGCSLRQLEGRRYMDYVHPDDAAGTEEIFGDLLKGKVVAGYINRYHCGQGRYVHLEWWAQHIDDRVYASARDVTRTKEAEHALERALEQERAAVEIKGRLISMASHEFRTPLTVIRMRAEMLGLTLPNLDTAAIRERLGSIVEACSHLTEIVTDVLDYSSLGRAESVEQPADIEFGSLLSDLVTGLERGEAEDRRINLCMPQHPMYLKSYASLLRRAVGNVLENALKYSPSPLPVRVTCSAKNHGVLLEVADKGIGIPPGEVSDLFNPFYRASNVGRVRGTGLGLAICKEAMDRLGGTISHRPNPDGGSIFTLLFPPHPPTCNNPRPAKGTAVPFATVTCMHNE